MNRDFAKLGSEYANNVLAALDRLANNGTVLAEDLKAFEGWTRRKTRSCEAELLAEGATAGELATWRTAFRNQIAPPTKGAKATV